MKRPGLLCSILFLSALAAARAQNPGEDQQKLQGTWKILAGNESGKTMLPSRVKGSKMIVAGNKIKVQEQEKELTLTYTMDPAKHPRAIDLTMESGKRKGEMSRGIYTFEGGLLKICFAGPGKVRPSSFTPAPGSGERLFVLKRATP